MLMDTAFQEFAGTDIEADIAIVGAGTVGLFLAASLIEESPRPPQIVLIEAGSRIAQTATNALTASSVGRPHSGVLMGRASGLGGTSALWGGQLAEFDRVDLERTEAAWPLTYDELLGHYATVYRRLGLDAIQPAGAYRERFGGESAGEATARDVGAERFFTHWLDQPNFAKYYRKFIAGEPHVRVVLHLNAHDLVFDGDRATALLCQTADGRCVRVRASQMVFASGTIPTCRFFLSTQKTSAVPWADNRHIGLYFQDHLGGKLADVQVLDEARFRDFFENGWVEGNKIQPKLRLSAAARGEVDSGACAFFSFDSSVAQNLAHVKRFARGIGSALTFSSGASLMQDLWAVGRSSLPIAARYLRDRRVLALFDRGVSLNVQAEQIPTPASRIYALEGEQADDGLLKVAVDWQADGREIAAVRELAHDADGYLQRQGIARLTIDPEVLSDRSRYLERLSDTYHQCGGMRMSTLPSDGVVDPQGRVWGTSNVWVAGAATFPTSSHANCTLTALAMSARLASHLVH